MFTMQAFDGEISFLIGSGALIGDVGAPRDFSHTFSKALRDWLNIITSLRGTVDRQAICLYTVSPVTTTASDLATGVYADDTARITAINDFDDCLRREERTDTALAQAFYVTVWLPAEHHLCPVTENCPCS